MFPFGVSVLELSFVSAAGFIITIPSAVAAFAWIATIHTGRVKLTVPFLFFAGFVLLFFAGVGPRLTRRTATKQI